MTLSPERMLVELVGELSALRDRVQALEGQDLATTVGGIRQTLADLMGAVEQLQEAPEAGPLPWPGTAPDWTKVDQVEARKLWDWLLEWCQSVLWPTYAGQVWRPCWYRHQRVRIELTWLCANWHWSYEPTAPPTRAAEWHARWWPHVEQVMKRELAQCGYRTERLRDPKHPVPNERPLNDFADDEIFDKIEVHIASRPKPPDAEDEAAD